MFYIHRFSGNRVLKIMNEENRLIPVMQIYKIEGIEPDEYFVGMKEVLLFGVVKFQKREYLAEKV